MQHIKQIESTKFVFVKSNYTKALMGVLIIIWVIGLLLAGSDSPYMPWVNGFGLLLFFGATVIIGKLLNKEQIAAAKIIYPKFTQKPVKSEKTYVSTHQNQRVNTRYAMGV